MISTQVSSQRGPSSLKRIRQGLRSYFVRAIVLGCWLLAMIAYQVLGHQPKRSKPKASVTAATQVQAPTLAQRSFVVPAAAENHAAPSLSALQPQPPTALR